MHARFDRWLHMLRTGFWFIPTVMLALASVFAITMLYIDQRFDPGMSRSIAWAYSGGPEGARSLLSTIAGSMITAASVTFSLASVALSIASQQYGSRVLRNFMRDRITQILLGTFIATFIYSVLIVRAIRGSDVSGGFVPAIAVTMAIALSLVSLVLLVFFVHHVSTSIQASHIVLVIAEDLRGATLKLYPSRIGSPINEPAGHDDCCERGSASVALADSGYLQSLDLDGLFQEAKSKQVVIELTVKPGDHLICGEVVARVWGTTFLSESDLKEIMGAFLLGGERTPTQDIRYQFQQLTDVVVRALSLESMTLLPPSTELTNSPPACRNSRDGVAQRKGDLMIAGGCGSSFPGQHSTKSSIAQSVTSPFMRLPIASSWLGFAVCWTRWSRTYPVVPNRPG